MRISLRLALLATFVPLAGCMTTGTNMHNDFACRAPNGTCAPMSVIDGKAVAGMGATAQPIGGIVDPAMPREGRVVAASSDGTPPGRTADRVLRVVFPAHIDASGIYHDESTAHAVVERGAWTDGLTGGRQLPVTTAATADRASPDASSSKLASLDEVIAARAPNMKPEPMSAPARGAVHVAEPQAVRTPVSLRSTSAIDLREAAAAATAGPVGGLDPNFDTPDVTAATSDEPGAPSGHCTGYRPVWWHGHAYRRLRPVPCPVVAAVSTSATVAAGPAPLPGTTVALNRAIIERSAAPVATTGTVATAAPVAIAATTPVHPATSPSTSPVVVAANKPSVPPAFGPTTDPKVAAARVSAMAAPIVADQVRIGRDDAKAAAVPELGSLFARASDATPAGTGTPR